MKRYAVCSKATTPQGGSHRWWIAARPLLAGLALLVSFGFLGCGDDGEGGGAPVVDADTRLERPVGPRVEPVGFVEDNGPTVADDPVPATAYLQIPDQETFWVASGPGTSNGFSWYNSVSGPGQDIVGPHQALTQPYTIANPEDFLELAAGRVVSSAADQVFSMTKTGVSQDNTCYLVRYRVEGQMNPRFSAGPIPAYEFEDFGAYPGACVAARDRWQESPFAIAIGDLDWDGTGGEFHDEIVLVTESGDAGASPPGFPMVTVLDYARQPGQVVPTHLRLGTGLAYPNAKGGDVGLGRVRAVVYNPDATADPRQEYIAVLHTSPGGLSLSLLQYLDGTLSVVGQPVTLGPVKTSTLLSTPIDLAAGDFDGDGNEELAVAYIDRRSDTSAQLYAVHLHIFSGTSLTQTASKEFTTSLPSDKNQDQLSPDCSPQCSTLNSDYRFLHADLRLAPAVYELAAQGGVSVKKEQLAVGVVHLPDTSSSKPAFRVMLVDFAATPSHAINSVTQAANVIIPKYAASGKTILNYKFDIKGMYLHGADPTAQSSVASLVLSYFDFYPPSSPDSNDLLAFRDTRTLQNGVFPIGDLSANPFAIGKQYTGDAPNPPSTLNVRLVGYDDDGDSLQLGQPTVFSLDQITQVTSVFQSPPMHLDFLPRSQSSEEGGMVNVSADDEFYVKVGQAGSASMSVSSEQKDSQATNNTTEESTAVENKVRFLAGGDDSSMKFSAEQEQAYEGTKTNSNEATQQSQYSVEVDPGYDDCVALTATTGDIWRYPVIGGQNEDPNDPTPASYYMEVYRPRCPDGSYVSSTNQCNPQIVNKCAPGKSIDGYEPIHENLNVLSYPRYTATQGVFSPPDLGGWETPDQCDAGSPVQPNGVCQRGKKNGNTCTSQSDCPGGKCITKKTLSAPNLEFSVGQTGTEATISLSADAMCSTSQDTSNSFKSNNSVKIENEAYGSVFFDRVETTSEFGYTNSDEFTWSTLDSNSATISREQEIKLSVPKKQDASFTYYYRPALYTAQDGSLNLAFATNTGSPSGQTTAGWINTDPEQGYYNPDPALNLPNKWKGNCAWVASVDFDANRMRGFFLRDPNDVVEPSSGLGRLLADPPTWGQTVQLQVRVYNYSTSSNVGPVKVRFDIADLDDAQQNIEPNSRRVLGEVTAVFTDEAFYPEGPPRGLDGTAQSPAGGTVFPPRGVGRATLNLDTGCIPVSQSDRSCLPILAASADFRIYAVIDPEGTIANETHGWRAEEVALMPNAGGSGRTIRVKAVDDSGSAVGTVEIKSWTSPASDVRCLRAAFYAPVATGGNCYTQGYGLVPGDNCCVTASGMDLTESYGLQASFEDLGGVSRVSIATDDEEAMRLPDSTDLRSGVLAFEEPVNGTSTLQFVADTTTLTTGNLLIGQNNEGWAALGVYPAGSGGGALAEGAVGAAAATTSDDGRFDLFMKTDSLAGYDLSGRFETELVTTLVGRETQIRVCGHADQILARYVRVPVHARHPGHPGEMLAHLRLHGVNGDEGSCTWFTWTPREPGRFKLYALLAEPRGDRLLTNNIDELEVEVLE